MLSRAVLVVLTLFWVTMNVLLWRAEYGSRGRGGAVPPEVIWQKMLTAPDSSSLSVMHKGRKIGFCQWTTSIGEEMNQLREKDEPPEGMVKKVSGYHLQVEGNLALGEFSNRLRFDGKVSLSTNQEWREISLRVNLREETIEIQSLASERSLRLSVGEGELKSERIFHFEELQNPDRILGELGGPVATLLLANTSLGGKLDTLKQMLAGIRWEARDGVVRLGLAPARTYRLEGRVLDRYRAVVFVSRAGEVLRVELPDDVVLTNDQLAPLQ